MKTQELKTLIKEAVREVLKEELANLGKQKIQESLTSQEEWPTMKFNSTNINPASTNPALRQSLMDQMGIPTPPSAVPTTFAEKQNVYQDMLAQVASEMRQNPGEVNNFRSIG
jgi:hypothetical protein